MTLFQAYLAGFVSASEFDTLSNTPHDFLCNCDDCMSEIVAIEEDDDDPMGPLDEFPFC